MTSNSRYSQVGEKGGELGVGVVGVAACRNSDHVFLTVNFYNYIKFYVILKKKPLNIEHPMVILVSPWDPQLLSVFSP